MYSDAVHLARGIVVTLILYSWVKTESLGRMTTTLEWRFLPEGVVLRISPSCIGVGAMVGLDDIFLFSLGGGSLWSLGWPFGHGNDMFYFIAYGAEVLALSSCALSLPSFRGVSFLQASSGYTLGGFIRLVVFLVAASKIVCDVCVVRRPRLVSLLRHVFEKNNMQILEYHSSVLSIKCYGRVIYKERGGEVP